MLRYDLNDELMDLRVLFLRTAADVWNSDDKGRSRQPRSEERLSEPEEPGEDPYQLLVQLYEGIFDNLGKRIEVLKNLNILLAKKDVISKEFLDKVQNNGLLRTLVESSEPQNLNTLWMIKYGSGIRFQNFGVQIIKPTARWNYYGDNQWIKPDTEALYLSLPECVEITEALNKEQDQTIRAIKLTEYYQSFPSFFGLIKDAPKPTSNWNENLLNVVKKLDFAPFFDNTLILQNKPFETSQNDLSGNNYDLGIANDAFLSFSSMLIKLIPVLWENESLKNQLNYVQRMVDVLDPDRKEHIDSFTSEFELSYTLNNLDGELAKKRDALNVQYNLELNAILREHFDYESPWVFNIRLIYPNETAFKSIFKSVSNNTEGQQPKSAKEYILNMTTIEIPYAPSEKDKAHTSLALARYNATGPSFPFTCS